MSALQDRHHHEAQKAMREAAMKQVGLQQGFAGRWLGQSLVQIQRCGLLKRICVWRRAMKLDVRRKAGAKRVLRWVQRAVVAWLRCQLSAVIWEMREAMRQDRDQDRIEGENQHASQVHDFATRLGEAEREVDGLRAQNIELLVANEELETLNEGLRHLQQRFRELHTELEALLAHLLPLIT